MIQVEFFQKNGMFVGVKMFGHAGYADAGEDIACASVSSAVQLTANTMTECLEIPAEISVEENSILIEIPENSRIQIAAALLNGLMLHFELLSQEFENTITIQITEL